MKHLIFSYGSLILPENLERFKSKIIKSVFITEFKLKVIKSPITKTNYHYILLEQTWKENDIVPGFLIETECIDLIDKWEGSSYKRIEITCIDRYMEKIKCFIYVENK